MSICTARQAETRMWGEGSRETAMAAALHLDSDCPQVHLQSSGAGQPMSQPISQPIMPQSVAAEAAMVAVATDYNRSGLPSCRADMAFVRWVYGRTWPAASHGIFALPDGRVDLQITYRLEKGEKEDGRVHERAVRLSTVSGPARRHLLDAYAALEEEGPRECGIMDNQPWQDEKEPQSGLSRLYRD
ncbi:hypothetical protein ACT6QH_08355 [Xanthobacter sp. TB0139]|uniref:hypothetical protein n=1 Tax=Xanthobacter sp. TB0139 TaxID=3459178 RepID=UPI00403994A2